MFSTVKPLLRDFRPPEISVEGSITGSIRTPRDDIFFAAVQTTIMPMVITDPRLPDDPIVFANTAFTSMTGYDADEVIGMNCRFLQGPNTDKATVAAISDAIRNREKFTTEILNYRKDGTTFWNALFITPVYNKDQELVYFFASQLDISRRCEAEDGLAQAQKMEALGQLTGSISHDFNNLLQVMSGHLDILQRRIMSHEIDESLLLRSTHGIRSAINKAAILTQQLLAFSRKQRLQTRMVNLNTIALDVFELVEATLGNSIQIEHALTPDLQNCRLDSTQLEVCLLNILVNARDAMPDGGTVTIKTANITVAADHVLASTGLEVGSYVSISITDTGGGIPKEILCRVMDPFFTTKDEGKGTGLGLSMVYGFAKQSGGLANICSELGMGTTVRLYFPVPVGESEYRSSI